MNALADLEGTIKHFEDSMSHVGIGFKHHGLKETKTGARVLEGLGEGNSLWPQVW